MCNARAAVIGSVASSLQGASKQGFKLIDVRMKLELCDGFSLTQRFLVSRKPFIAHVIVIRVEKEERLAHVADNKATSADGIK